MVLALVILQYPLVLVSMALRRRPESRAGAKELSAISSEVRSTVRNKKSFPKKTYQALLVLTVALVAQSTARADMALEDAVKMAQALYENLTTVPMLPDDALFNPVVQKVRAGDMQGAAELITHPRTGSNLFYDIRVANLALPYNRTQSTAVAPHESMAMLLVYARDGYPYDQFFHADRIAFDPNRTGGEAYTQNPESHFSNIFRYGVPRNNLTVTQRVNGRGFGVYTSHSFGTNYIEAGTNRRITEGTLNNFFCSTVDNLRTSTLPTTYVLRDIPRVQQGSLQNFETTCKTCHSWLDGMTAAFSRVDFARNPNQPAASWIWKLIPSQKLNEKNWASHDWGSSESFIIWQAPSQASILGIRGTSENPIQNYGGDSGIQYVQGRGMEQFGKIIGNAMGPYRCLATKAVSYVYMKRIHAVGTLSDEEMATLEGQRPVIEQMASSFYSHRNVRKLMEEVAIYYATNVR